MTTIPTIPTTIDTTFDTTVTVGNTTINTTYFSILPKRDDYSIVTSVLNLLDDKYFTVHTSEKEFYFKNAYRDITIYVDVMANSDTIEVTTNRSNTYLEIENYSKIGELNHLQLNAINKHLNAINYGTDFEENSNMIIYDDTYEI